MPIELGYPERNATLTRFPAETYIKRILVHREEAGSKIGTRPDRRIGRENRRDSCSPWGKDGVVSTGADGCG